MSPTNRAALVKIGKGLAISVLGALAASLASPDIQWDSNVTWIVTLGSNAVNILYQFLRSRWGGPLAALAALALLPAGARAQNAASPFSHGPTVPFFVAEFDSVGNHGGVHVGMLNAGAGYSFNWNYKPVGDGSVRMLNLGLPVFVNFQGGDPSDLRVMVGGTIGTFNNLISIGPAIKVIDVAEGQAPGGVFTGISREDVVLLVSFSINLGGGVPKQAAAGARAGLLAVPADQSPPPCYVRF